MTYLNHDTDNPQWLDCRLYSPSPHCYCIFEVAALMTSIDKVWVGRAGFLPNSINKYQTGKWDKFMALNGGTHNDGEILFWRQNPTIPINEPQFSEIIR